MPALGPFASVIRRSPLQPAEQRSSLPATRFVPFEAFPSSIAVPHHCGRCPPAVVVPHLRRVVPKHDCPEMVRDADARWQTPPERYSLTSGSRPEPAPSAASAAMPPPYTASDAGDHDPRFVQRVHSRRRVPGVQASVCRASCQTGAWIARLPLPMPFARSRLPLPARRALLRVRSSRGTVAVPAAASVGLDRLCRVWVWTGGGWSAPPPRWCRQHPSRLLRVAPASLRRSPNTPTGCPAVRFEGLGPSESELSTLLTPEREELSHAPRRIGPGLDRASVPVARRDAFTASVPFDDATPREA
jgi:hypothetical protein